MFWCSHVHSQMKVAASKHPPRHLVVALKWLINTMQLYGLDKTSYLGYFLARVRGVTNPDKSKAVLGYKSPDHAWGLSVYRACTDTAVTDKIIITRPGIGSHPPPVPILLSLTSIKILRHVFPWHSLIWNDVTAAPSSGLWRGYSKINWLKTQTPHPHNN